MSHMRAQSDRADHHGRGLHPPPSAAAATSCASDDDAGVQTNGRTEWKLEKTDTPPPQPLLLLVAAVAVVVAAAEATTAAALETRRNQRLDQSRNNWQARRADRCRR
jgi:hypothetical protein